MVVGLGFRVWGLGFRVARAILIRFGFQRLGFRIYCLGFMVQGLGLGLRL